MDVTQLLFNHLHQFHNPFKNFMRSTVRIIRADH